jgi:hypothetical protein
MPVKLQPGFGIGQISQRAPNRETREICYAWYRKRTKVVVKYGSVIVGPVRLVLADINPNIAVVQNLGNTLNAAFN